MDSIANIRRQTALAELLEQGWLKHVEWRTTVDSTNSLAKQWYAAQPAQTPALFLADEQTAGRGRSGNSWWSPNGCLMLTIAVPAAVLPNDPASHPQLALVTGTALAETVDILLCSSTGGNGRARLKWPNDIYFDDRKLAGILIENLQSRSQPNCFAIGIGINTQIDWRDAPLQLLDRAVCLSSLAGRPLHCETVLLELVQQLQNHLANWRERPDSWLSSWRERCFLTHRIVRVRVGESDEAVGRCEGIDSGGRLLLRTENQLLALTACEIVSWN